MTATPSSDLELSATARQLSVVIPARAAGDMLSRCLSAIQSADPPPGEVIVVIDGRDDALATIARSFHVKVIELPTPRGAAGARNAGAESGIGTFLLFVDADVVIAPNAIGEAMRSLREHPEWCAVFGSYDDAPGAANFVAQYKGLLNHFFHQNGCVEASTFWSGLGAIRRDVFLGIGGFDETSRLEDIDLGYRLRAAGHRIGLNPQMLAKHLKRWTTVSLVRSDLFDRAIPWTDLMLRYRNSAADLNLDRTNRLSVILVFFLIAGAIAIPFRPIVLIPFAVACALGLLYLNRRLYRFFFSRRGFAFLCGAIVFHWLYFVTGGSGFLYAWMRHLVSRPTDACVRHEAPKAEVATR